LPLQPISNDCLPSPEVNTHHNALRQVSLEWNGLHIQGFSISGLSSYLQFPELDLCFDMGECPLSAIPLNHVFLTHAHGDHSRCLMRHDSLRKMIGIEKPAAYYLPENIYANACNWVRAEALFEGVSEARFTLPNLIPVPPQQWLPFAYRPDLIYRSFPVRHSITSQGFTIAVHKRKLRDEFVGLKGPEIVELKRQNIDITREVIEPKVTYIGDCMGETLLEQDHIWDSEILVLECTFLDPDEQAMARKKGHTHIEEIRQALLAMGDRVKCQKIILKHFSMKYSKKHILYRIAHIIPPEFLPRVEALL